LWSLTVEATFKPAFRQSCSARSNSAALGREVIGAANEIVVSCIRNDGGRADFRTVHLVELDLD